MIAAMVYALPFLWQGFVLTLAVSGLVVAGSLVIGLLLGTALAFGPRWLGLPIRVFADTARAIPLIVLIFTVYYGLPALGLSLSPFWAAVAALTLFKTGHVIEIVRGAIGSIHPGQMEAAKTIGLTFANRLRYVIFPQAVRRFLPPWINAVTDSVKGSALVSLVGVVDLMMAIQQVIGRTFEPMPLYILGAAIYIAVNATLSIASRRLEARFAATVAA
ncbi:amino acid ABC transporter permease [Elioraea sp.]|uniref:amino acid ABC transporter permease n=1 Tax=Elioraea sp. TaxID=2185103 RepID=UPI0025BD4621|nr:amino acid ABC transporter permease [Elioraea sp.]